MNQCNHMDLYVHMEQYNNCTIISFILSVDHTIQFEMILIVMQLLFEQRLELSLRNSKMVLKEKLLIYVQNYFILSLLKFSFIV